MASKVGFEVEFSAEEADHALEHISAANNMISESIANELLGELGNGGCTIRSLDVSDNDVGNGFAHAIAQNPMFRNLETLHLAGNKVYDTGASDIRKSWILKNLRLLMLDKANVSEQEQERLIAEFGDRIVFT